MSAAMTHGVWSTRCPCGVNHRFAGPCQKGLDVANLYWRAEEIAELMRALPPNTLAIADARGSRATARSLGSTDDVLLWLADVNTFAGGEVELRGGTLRYLASHGGGVTNNYRHSADTDEVRAVSYDGRILIAAWRGVARHGPHGRVANPDVLMTLTWAQTALQHTRYSLPFIRAAKRARELDDLLQRRARGLYLAAEQEVELDLALERGHIE